MRPVENVVQIVIVIVDLGWRELALVDNVLRRQRADVETLCKGAV
jgi:hypothetical protein